MRPYLYSPPHSSVASKPKFQFDASTYSQFLSPSSIWSEKSSNMYGSNKMNSYGSGGVSMPPAFLRQHNVKAEPEADAVKMFVGQIPRDWDEKRLRDFFEKYGPIYHLNILRDKQTSVSRGCCFITYYTLNDAMVAQSELHDQIKLPGMNHFIQMKPADQENRNERKLFIGMLNKKTSESELKSCFQHFGNVEECTILKNPDGSSKGCAFVMFSSKSAANEAAIKMNGQILEGSNNQLVVKQADSPKEKENKKMQQQQQQVSSLNYLSQIPTPLHSSAPYLNLMQLHNSSVQQMAGLSVSGLQAALAAQSVAAQGKQTACVTPPNQFAQNNSTANLNGGFNNSALAGLYGLSPAATPVAGCSPVAAGLDALQLSSGLPSYTSGYPGGSFFQIMPNAQQSQQTTRKHDKQKEGPDGANLFIYHLPADFTDEDLKLTFAPFGNVISAKVYIDKNTNLSKCFGFVSYDNPLNATMAINALDGFQIGLKRLKVQLKRAKPSGQQQQQHQQSSLHNSSSGTMPGKVHFAAHSLSEGGYMPQMNGYSPL